VNNKPYRETPGKEYSVREFLQSTSSLEYVWHRDKEDRYVQPINYSDWKLQLDNTVPVEFGNSKLFIPKETYHRLIKGTGDITLKVWKL
tara:strand:- start:8353 stop:8619 length:267 start_codon:yes stop_codon:yes gene_type:complete